MILDEIKARMTLALRARDEIRKNVLGLALGEVQTAEARANRALRDDEVASILRKLIKANEETLALTQDAPRRAALESELAALGELLPPSMTAEQVAQALAPVHDAIRAAKADGQAMGVAMKHLKASGHPADADTVQQVVKQLRA